MALHANAWQVYRLTAADDLGSLNAEGLAKHASQPAPAARFSCCPTGRPVAAMIGMAANDGKAFIFPACQ